MAQMFMPCGVECFLMVIFWNFAGGGKDMARRGYAYLCSNQGRTGGESRGWG